MAQSQKPTPTLVEQVSEALWNMQKHDLPGREAGFDELMRAIASDEASQGLPPDSEQLLARYFDTHPNQSERVKVGLIQLLAKEDETFISDKSVPPGTYTENDSEYYATLIDTVSSLNDDRAIPALVGAMTTGGIAGRGVLKYGDKALGPVLEQLKNPDGLVRASALGMSVVLLDARHDPASHKQAIGLIRLALTDSASAMREEAVLVIRCLAERQDFVSALENISKTDPENFPGRSDDGVDGDHFYPVRVVARQVLRDIQNNAVCP